MNELTEQDKQRHPGYPKRTRGTLSIKERFDKYIFYSPDGCWYWTASLNDSGYGQFSMDRKIIKAHRASYYIYKGDIEGKQVLHSCDNPACVNPNHLYLGTHDDNMRDMALRNRSSHGERKRNAIFTDNQIRVIREAAAAGHRQRDIVKYFKRDKSSISAIINRKQWKRIY